jgi:thymidine kinase
MASTCGSLHLILGPMHSGKTTELLRRKRRAEIAHKKCVVIKYGDDRRYDTSSSDSDSSSGLPTGKIYTHDHVSETAVVSLPHDLRGTLHNIPQLESYQCIFIDEIQFYPDAAEVCDQLADQGHSVTVCGLQGDFMRRLFVPIGELIPLAESITHLTAIDPETGQDASFTARLGLQTEQELIGGVGQYIATNRAHYHSIMCARYMRNVRDSCDARQQK